MSQSASHQTATWDIWMDDKLVSTLSELKTYCAGLGITVGHFLSFPVADLMPDEMKVEATLECQDRLGQLLAAAEASSQMDGTVRAMEDVLEKGSRQRTTKTAQRSFF